MVIDTSIFIDYLRAKNKAKTRLQNLPDDAVIYVSSVTLYELYMGATTPQKWVDIKKLTDGITVLSFDQEVAEKAAIIYQELRRANELIEFRDIFIAATAIIHDLPVLSRNAKHFKRIKALTVITE
jgi:predicted nucleic acid-binding protein